MGRCTVKRWSGALQHARGQSNKWAAVKNQYLLINFPTLLACKKASGTMFVLALSPSLAPLSSQTQGPNRERCWQSGRLDQGQMGEKRTGPGSHVGFGRKIEGFEMEGRVLFASTYLCISCTRKYARKTFCQAAMKKRDPSEYCGLKYNLDIKTGQTQHPATNQ